MLQTVCKYGFDLGLVPLPELDDGPGREGGKHGDYVPASSVSAPGLRGPFIEAVRPLERAVAGLGGVVWRLAHAAVVLGLGSSGWCSRQMTISWRESSHLQINLHRLKILQYYMFQNHLAYGALGPVIITCEVKLSYREGSTFCKCLKRGHNESHDIPCIVSSLPSLYPCVNLFSGRTCTLFICILGLSASLLWL